MIKTLNQKDYNLIGQYVLLVQETEATDDIYSKFLSKEAKGEINKFGLY